MKTMKKKAKWELAPSFPFTQSAPSFSFTQYTLPICGLSFVTQYNSSLSRFVPNFRILSQVVAEKSLTEKKFTDRQTDKHSYRKGKNYIPPKYFVPGV